MMELFWAFLKIGAFAFGGAYGAIPLIRDTVLSHGWMDAQMFANLTAVAESTPGPIMVNLATYVGAVEAGLPGALVATLGVVLPSFVLILAAGVGLCSDAVFSGGSADPVAAAVLGALLLGELASLGLRKKPLAPGALIGASAVMGIALSLI